MSNNVSTNSYFSDATAAASDMRDTTVTFSSSDNADNKDENDPGFHHRHHHAEPTQNEYGDNMEHLEGNHQHSSHQRNHQGKEPEVGNPKDSASLVPDSVMDETLNPIAVNNDNLLSSHHHQQQPNMKNTIGRPNNDENGNTKENHTTKNNNNNSNIEENYNKNQKQQQQQQHNHQHHEQQTTSEEYDAIIRDAAFLLEKKLDNTKGWAKKLLRDMTIYVKTIEEVKAEYVRIQRLEHEEAERLDQMEPDVEGATLNLLTTESTNR